MPGDFRQDISQGLSENNRSIQTVEEVVVIVEANGPILVVESLAQHLIENAAIVRDTFNVSVVPS